MSTVEIKLNTKAIGNLLKSEEAKQLVTNIANGKAGGDSHVKSFIGYNRAIAIVYPNTKRHPQ